MQFKQNRPAFLERHSVEHQYPSTKIIFGILCLKSPKGTRARPEGPPQNLALFVAKLKVSVNSEDNSADILTAPRPWTSLL